MGVVEVASSDVGWVVEGVSGRVVVGAIVSGSPAFCELCVGCMLGSSTASA